MLLRSNIHARSERLALGTRCVSNFPPRQKMDVNSSGVLPLAAGTICRARLTNGLVNNGGKWRLPSGRGVQRKISRRVKPLASWVATCALLFSPCVPVYAGLLKGDVDFSNYDAPLFQQIVNRIKAKVAARLGEGVNTRDRYFIVPFAYQDKRINPEFSHSFISVIRVLADGKQPSLTSGFRRGRFKNRDFEAFTISWLPHDFDTNPHLCVFDGVGSRVDPTENKCPISVGRNFRLDETLKLAVNVKMPSACGDPTRPRKRRLILPPGSSCSTEELSIFEPMTAFIARIESRSIVSMRWLGWKNFTLTEDFLGRDLGCGASMVPHEF
jgi:hypothetical protein